MVCDGEGAWVVAAVLKEKVINGQGSYDRDRGLAASVAFGPLRITSPADWVWGMRHGACGMLHAFLVDVACTSARPPPGESSELIAHISLPLYTKSSPSPPRVA
jgi:hypothetical protein